LAALPPAVGAETFPCDALRELAGAAPAHFQDRAGAVRETQTAADLAARMGVSETDLDMEYERSVREATIPLAGADRCEVVDTVTRDEDMDLRRTAFDCRYGAITRVSAELSAELVRCLGGEADPESDDESLLLVLDRVDSGEGYAATEAGLETNGAEGLTLSIARTVCMNRSEGGCEDL